VQSFRNRLLQCGSPMGSQALPVNLLQVGLLSPWVRGPGRSLLQHRLHLGSQPPAGIHLLQCVVPSTGCRWISAPPWSSLGCRGTTCLTTVFIMNFRGKVSALAPGAPPPPPSSLILVSAELFLSHHFTPLSWLLPFRSFLPFLKYVITEVLPPLLIGSALASGESISESAGTGSVGYGGSF